MWKFGKLWGLTLTLIGLMSVSGISDVLFQNVVDVPIPGCDEFGNPSDENQGIGSGKIYKDAASDALFIVAKASVVNDFGRAVRFRDLSYLIFDPWSEQYFSSTNNAISLKKPQNGISVATAVAVYLP